MGSHETFGPGTNFSEKFFPPDHFLMKELVRACENWPPPAKIASLLSVWSMLSSNLEAVAHKELNIWTNLSRILTNTCTYNTAPRLVEFV